MIIKIIRTDVKLVNVSIDDIIYEISLNDTHHYYIRKSVYDKLNTGDYYLVYHCGNLEIFDRLGSLVKKLNDLVF